ncbi:RcnB family protein [Phenylobacterium soli]|uniref:ATP-dependent RNA helicase n=1 Tax=Phenylobacterium soli TaxID=2170551 RepID=A0A328ANY8_9CAUL|nr:RcnB family protein [Phenylobacterium soli]RAK54568.1 hypothetical protein DJ017_08545 [Phenylobacterium soli]
MKTKIAAAKIASLAALLLAGSATAALAQEQTGREDRGDRPFRPHGQEHVRPQQQQQQQQPQGFRPQPQVQAPAQPPAPPQPQAAPQAREPRSFGPGVRTEGPRRPQNDGGAARHPGRWRDTEGDDTSQGLSGPDRADQEDRQELRDWRRYNGGRTPGVEDQRRPEPRRPNEHVRESDRRTHDGAPGGVWDRDRDRDQNRQGDWQRDRQGDRRGDPRDGGRWDREHARDRDHRDRPQWRPGVWPHAYESHRRFRAPAYRRPPHFYVHVWSFGDILPPTWYGPEYVLWDWWAYDLPAPPYGYDWVRVGDDALLVDDFTGRVVQVVRGLFW